MSPLDGLLSRLEESEQRYSERNQVREAVNESIQKGDYVGANTTENIRRRLSHMKVAPEITERVGTRSLDPVLPQAPASDSRAVIENIALERVLGSNDMMPISFLDLGRQRARSVGRIHIRDQFGSGQGYGTGFLVSPHLMLTNNHVLSDSGSALHSEVEFDFEVSLSGELRSSRRFRLDPESFFLTNKDLDFTLVKILPEGEFEPRQWGWIPLVQQDGLIVKGEYVSIIQHPNGEAKQIALRENRVIDLFDPFAHYQTDTAPGSSGSPVFNDQWELVALHHSGVPARSDDGKILSVDNQPWEKWMGEHRIKWNANEGVSGKRIADCIDQDDSLPAIQRSLRDELFSIGPPPEATLYSFTPSNQTLSASGVGSTEHSTSDNSSKPGVTTITVPIQIQIGIGRGGDLAAQAIAAATPVSATAAAVPDTKSSTTDHDQANLSDLNLDLAQVQDGRRRPYYDAAKDEVDRTKYYSDVSHQGVTGPEMFRMLSRLLEETHSDKVRYRPSRHVYPWVDLHPDRQLRSVYSGKTFAPETLIQEDYRIESERKMMMQELLRSESTLPEADFAEQLDLLESQNPFNCEHVVPQSWYSKREPMRGDLHHLFACESGCNSFRGNLGYFDFADFDEAVRNQCGKRIDNRFEPGAGKGVVARATLYFLLRYPGQIDDPSELPEERIATLIDWHQANEVTQYERHRNQAIFEKQGNRNPLIDFPGLAAKIDFSLGLG